MFKKAFFRFWRDDRLYQVSYFWFTLLFSAWLSAYFLALEERNLEAGIVATSLALIALVGWRHQKHYSVFIKEMGEDPGKNADMDIPIYTTLQLLAHEVWRTTKELKTDNSHRSVKAHKEALDRFRRLHRACRFLGYPVQYDWRAYARNDPKLTRLDKTA